MFWASSGPASNSPFLRTATSFILLNSSPLLPDLPPIPQLGNVSRESQGHILSLSVTVYRGRNLHSCSFCICYYLKDFWWLHLYPGMEKRPWKLQKLLRHTTSKRGELMSTIYELEELLHLFTGLAHICCIMQATLFFFCLLVKSTWFPPS